jgi:hypothetical protein
MHGVARLFGRLERHPGAVFTAVGAVFIAAYLVALTAFPKVNGRMLDGDAIQFVLVSVYVNACVSDWWAGEAFGARRFVGDTVFFALGLAAVFAERPWAGRPALVRAGALALVAYNLLFLLQYQLFMRGFHELAPYPATVRQILIERLAIPWRLLHAWLS